MTLIYRHDQAVAGHEARTRGAIQQAWVQG